MVLLLLLLPVVMVVVLWGSILLLLSQPICASTSELKPMRSIRSHTEYFLDLHAFGSRIAVLYCFCNFVSCASIFCTLINTITVPSAPSVLLVMGSFEAPAF